MSTSLTSPLVLLLTAQPQGAEVLAARLGVSASSLPALAEQLGLDGVPVVLTGDGYALAEGTPAPGLVQPLLAGQGQFGRAMRYAGTVGSTQDEVRRWADDQAEPAPHGAVYVAERQTGGRGRRGRSWETTHGTLVFSLLLRPADGSSGAAGLELSPARLSLLPLAVGVALVQACGVGGLKWPNDLLSPDRRKLAGILLEADLRGEQVRRAVLGIGLNVSACPPGAAHLSEYRPDLSRAAVLSQVLPALEDWLTRPAAEVLSAWKACSLTLGQPVQVQTTAGPLVGTALDLDQQGGLILQTPTGRLQTVHAGDVQLIGALPSAQVQGALI